MLESIKGTIIEAIIKDEQFELPQELSIKIQEFWDKAQLENPNLWNGELMNVIEYKRECDKILIICQKTNFAHHLYDERIVLSNKYACTSLSAGCLLETSDNYYIVGELAPDTSFPYCMQVSGGNADFNDVKDEKIDVVNTIVRECQE